MNSEERVSKLLSEPIRVEDFRTALINLLNEHAAEARAEQRGACADKFDFEEDQLLCLNATGKKSDEK